MVADILQMRNMRHFFLEIKIVLIFMRHSELIRELRFFWGRAGWRKGEKFSVKNEEYPNIMFELDFFQ